MGIDPGNRKVVHDPIAMARSREARGERGGVDQPSSLSTVREDRYMDKLVSKMEEYDPTAQIAHQIAAMFA